jgi:predicted Fe-Mo cluster-binding NifX family protein
LNVKNANIYFYRRHIARLQEMAVCIVVSMHCAILCVSNVNPEVVMHFVMNGMNLTKLNPSKYIEEVMKIINGNAKYAITFMNRNRLIKHKK